LLLLLLVMLCLILNICVFILICRGSAIAKIIGHNAKAHTEFETQVNMWVYEEMVDGKKLTDIINTQHENVKYLPGVKLPGNIVAVPELIRAAEGATVLVFVVPHQFVKNICEQLKNVINNNNCKAISLIKGMDTNAKGISLISDVIRQSLGVDVSVLSGANIANEVALECFCETTIGYHNEANGRLFPKLVDAPYFRVNIIRDTSGVELCGALKNVIGLAAGFSDGLKYGSNTKAAIIRIGMIEMMQIAKMIDPNVKQETFFESCGLADVITTCYAGRNRKCAEAKVLTGQRFDEIEKELLNGQKLQGTLTSKEVHEYLADKNLINKFTLFKNVYRICYEDVDPKTLLQGL